MDKTFKLYFSPKKMIKLAVTSIFIIIVGIYCLNADITIIKTLGLLEIILGVFTFIIALKSSLNKNPQILINENGIIDNRILKNVILWEQIESLELTIINTQKVMKIIVPNNFANTNFKWLYIKTSKLRLAEKPKKILLNLDNLKVDYEKLNEFLKNNKSDYVSKNLDTELTGLGNLINKIFY